MVIAISGSSGLIGTHLKRKFTEKGWAVVELKRNDFLLPDEDFVPKLINADVIVNLAGAPVSKRWTSIHKKEMRDSRLITTAKIVKSINLLNDKPRLLISVSAIGIYEAEKQHTETSTDYSRDFLGRLCQDWEREASRVHSDTRLIIARIGVVLDSEKGALPSMIKPFKYGLGGKIHTGKQPFPWVHVEDVVASFLYFIENESTSGIYNITAPQQIDNLLLTKTICRFLKKPALFRVPKLVLKISFGEGAGMILNAPSVIPERLLDSGYRFKYLTIKSALKDLIGS